MAKKLDIIYIDKNAPESNPSEADAEVMRKTIKEKSPDLWDRLLDIERRDDVLEPIAQEMWAFVNSYSKPLNTHGQSRLLLNLRRFARLVSVRKHVESLEPFVIQGERSDSEERPMWTKENRGRYDRSKLRYPSDLTDEEWELIRPEIQPAKRGGNKRTVDIREIINAIMYVLSTGCQWRAIPKDLPPRSPLPSFFRPRQRSAPTSVVPI